MNKLIKQIKLRQNNANHLLKSSIFSFSKHNKSNGREIERDKLKSPSDRLVDPEQLGKIGHTKEHINTNKPTEHYQIEKKIYEDVVVEDENVLMKTNEINDGVRSETMEKIYLKNNDAGSVYRSGFGGYGTGDQIGPAVLHNKVMETIKADKKATEEMNMRRRPRHEHIYKTGHYPTSGKN